MLILYDFTAFSTNNLLISKKSKGAFKVPFSLLLMVSLCLNVSTKLKMRVTKAVNKRAQDAIGSSPHQNTNQETPANNRVKGGSSSAGSPSTTSSMDELVFAQAIDFVYHNQTTVIFTLMLMQIVVLIAMWQQINHILLVSWFLAGTAVLAGRYLLSSNYLKKQGNTGSPRRWAHYYGANALFNGIIWGSAIFLFFNPESLTNQVFLLGIAIGMTVGSLVVNSYYLPSFLLVASPVLLGAIARFIIVGGIEYYGLTVITTVFFGVGVKISMNTNKAMLEGIRLRFENLDLIQQLRVQKEAAEEANLAKSKFLAAASHDLRQPLHALSLFTGLLDSDNDKQRQHDLIGKINHSQSALSGLLNTLLDVSKLDAGIVEANLCDFELDNLLNHLIPEFESEGKEKGLYLRYQPTHIVVRSDPALLEIILRNLLSNAIHYTNEGGVTVQAQIIETSLQASRIKIEIADTGIGIPLEKQQEIFQEFHQLANPERNRAKGLGLGLAIVRRVSELLKHEIDLKSETGAGSKFSISLAEGNPEQVTRTLTEAVSVGQFAFPQTVVLFIDDEAEIREGMFETLNQWGCIAIVAASGGDAVFQLQAQALQPEVILSDYRLQNGENGVDAIHQVFEKMGNKVPALIITGDTAPERLREAKDSGYTLLHKPLQPAQIRAFIRSAINSRVTT